MERLSPTKVRIDTTDQAAFFEIAAYPYDARRLPVIAFDPAFRYVAAVGHVLRRYHDDDAWIREAAFRLDYGPITISGPAPAIDAVMRRITMAGTPAPVVLEFLYREADRISGVPFSTEGSHTMVGDELAQLLATDAAGDRLIAQHQSVIGEALNIWVNRNLHPDLTAEAEVTATLRGLRYEDKAMAPNAKRRSPIEAAKPAEPAWRRWIGDRVPSILHTPGAASGGAPLHPPVADPKGSDSSDS